MEYNLITASDTLGRVYGCRDKRHSDMEYNLVTASDTLDRVYGHHDKRHSSMEYKLVAASNTPARSINLSQTAVPQNRVQRRRKRWHLKLRSKHVAEGDILDRVTQIVVITRIRVYPHGQVSTRRMKAMWCIEAFFFSMLKLKHRHSFPNT